MTREPDARLFRLVFNNATTNSLIASYMALTIIHLDSPVTAVRVSCNCGQDDCDAKEIVTLAREAYEILRLGEPDWIEEILDAAREALIARGLDPQLIYTVTADATEKDPVH